MILLCVLKQNPRFNKIILNVLFQVVGKKKFSKNIFYLQLCARHDTQKHQKVIYAQYVDKNIL